MDTHRLSQTVQPLLVWFQAHARTLPWRADREPYQIGRASCRERV